MKTEPIAAAGPPAAEPLDWDRAARLLADGADPATLSERLGLPAGELDRRIQDDPLLRALLDVRRERAARSVADRIRDLRERVLEKLERELAKDNARVLLWLADRLKLVTPDTGRSRDDAVADTIHAMTPEERAEYEALAER